MHTLSSLAKDLNRDPRFSLHRPFRNLQSAIRNPQFHALLRHYCDLHKPIVTAIRTELPHLRATLAFARSRI